LDLLWQYHLRNKNFVGAASILMKLAEKKGENIGLVQRLEYLSRAKNCLAQGLVVQNETTEALQEKLDVSFLFIGKKNIFISLFSGCSNSIEDIQRFG
jgi:hypothetical protein